MGELHMFQFSAPGFDDTVALGIGYACILDEQSRDLARSGRSYESDITSSDATDVWDSVREEIEKLRAEVPAKFMN